MRFATSITTVTNGVPRTTTKPYDPSVIDTVGMFRPFSISYHGLTTNGQVRAYRFFPLTAGVTLEGQNVWSEDLQDTLRTFPNQGTDTIPSGIFRLAAQCRDDANAESVVDAGAFTKGVCQITVNFDPDTEIFRILNTYFKGQQAFVDTVRFEDAVPDTVPDRSWLTMFYRGSDSPFDSSRCQDDVNQCIAYQVQYTRAAQLNGGTDGEITSTIQWLPDDPEDNNHFGTPDTTTLNVSSQEYTLRARSVDEYGRPDGTPPEAVVVGNFQPRLTSTALRNYDDTIVGDGQTMEWYWLSPANLDPFAPGMSDTIDFNALPLPQVVKEFFFVVEGAGKDHPKENTDAGVKSWFYLFTEMANPDNIHRLGRSGFWVDGVTTNVLSDTVKFIVRYTLPNFDPNASIEAWRSLPSYLGTVFDLTVRGRDSGTADQFEQYMFLHGQKEIINQYNSSKLGRLTETGAQSFSLEMRPTARP
jgi:hypothetical protein